MLLVVPPVATLPDGVVTVIFLLFGLVFGSFGNVLIYRLPEGRTLGGRSMCMKCGRALNVLELIPLFSFIGLGGKCRTCRVELSWQYPLVELGSGLLFVFALLHSNFALLPAAILSLCLWLLFLIAVVDARTSLIPDALSLPLIALAMLLQVMRGSLDLSGLLVGSLFFAAQWGVSRGRWVGSGDILLGAGIGALLGSWQRAAVFLFCSYITGALIATLFLTVGRKTLKDPLPFGPFLVFGAFLTLIFGEAIAARLLPM